MRRFIMKNKCQSKPLAYKINNNTSHNSTFVKENVVISNEWEVEEGVLVIGDRKNNNEKNIKDMDTQEKIMMANAILNKQDESINKVKKVRKDRGLIEKTESSKIILTEDNRELLND